MPGAVQTRRHSDAGNQKPRGRPDHAGEAGGLLQSLGIRHRFRRHAQVEEGEECVGGGQAKLNPHKLRGEDSAVIRQPEPGGGEDRDPEEAAHDANHIAPNEHDHRKGEEPGGGVEHGPRAAGVFGPRDHHCADEGAADITGTCGEDQAPAPDQGVSASVGFDDDSLNRAAGCDANERVAKLVNVGVEVDERRQDGSKQRHQPDRERDHAGDDEVLPLAFLRGVQATYLTRGTAARFSTRVKPESGQR